MRLLAYWLLPGSLFIGHPVQAQPSDSRVICLVPRVAELPGGGGSRGIAQAIQRRTVYPLQALQAGAEGRVVVRFTVAANGRMQRIKVLQTFRYDCGRAVLEAIRQLPRFTATRSSTNFVVPVSFKIIEERPTAASCRNPKP